MNDRILSLLGICRKAGRLVVGADAVVDSVKKKKAKLIVFADDFSENSKRTVLSTADKYEVKTLTLSRSKEQLGRSLGKFCGVAAAEDKGFADKLEGLAYSELRGELYDKI